MADDGFAFDAPADQPQPMSVTEMAALLDRVEAPKRILACAPDVYERVRDAVEGGPLNAYFRVVEQPLLEDGQVLSIDPAALEPPPFEFEYTMPDYRCASCMAKVPIPGLCGICASMAGLLFGRRAGLSSLIVAPPPGV